MGKLARQTIVYHRFFTMKSCQLFHIVVLATAAAEQVLPVLQGMPQVVETSSAGMSLPIIPQQQPQVMPQKKTQQLVAAQSHKQMMPTQQYPTTHQNLGVEQGPQVVNNIQQVQRLAQHPGVLDMVRKFMGNAQIVNMVNSLIRQPQIIQGILQDPQVSNLLTQLGDNPDLLQLYLQPPDLHFSAERH